MRANLVYREFTRVGGAKAPDAKTMGRWGLALGPEVIKQIHESGGDSPGQWGSDGPQNARGHHGGRDEHPLSDRLELLGDGVRVLIRTMKRIGEIVGEPEPSCGIAAAV